MPIPEISMRKARNVTFPTIPSTHPPGQQPLPKDDGGTEAMPKTPDQGFRYPHPCQGKARERSGPIPPTDLGVKIMPLPSAENP